MDERAGPLRGVLSWKVYALLAVPWALLAGWQVLGPAERGNPTLTAVCLIAALLLVLTAVVAAVRHADSRRN
ncbi:hypothetical protein JL107_09905 [Nakamurella flavida]|uniref:Uncharacterized protein n=1 Tax=Nakamurella flavida TaxID=363630 RepID=A0A939C0I5_9ACTN|nr:hypothetical protein [Nakamurella flavida]MBM9476758.1 hypothetical protein [Nakamurella flavida]MDP9778804.1 hypothetical protein [Nakamurella flavida]